LNNKLTLLFRLRQDRRIRSHFLSLKLQLWRQTSSFVQYGSKMWAGVSLLYASGG